MTLPIQKYNDAIVSAADKAVDLWNDGLIDSKKAISMVADAVNNKRKILKNEPLLAGLIRVIDGAQENNELLPEEGVELRSFVLDLFENKRR